MQARYADPVPLQYRESVSRERVLYLEFIKVNNRQTLSVMSFIETPPSPERFIFNYFAKLNHFTWTLMQLQHVLTITVIEKKYI